MDKLAEIPRVFFTQNADGTYSIIGNWFTYANFTVATAIFGFSFLIACVATAAYYTLVVVTDPAQQGSLRSKRRIEPDTTSSLSDWDFEWILRLLFFAYTTYSTLDLESMECQNKIICEFQETDGIVGLSMRRISRFLLFFNIFDTIPYIKDYQEAVQRGQRRSDVNQTTNETLDEGNEECCQTFYPECAFSVDKFNEQFSGVFWRSNYTY